MHAQGRTSERAKEQQRARESDSARGRARTESLYSEYNSEGERFNPTPLHVALKDKQPRSAALAYWHLFVRVHRRGGLRIHTSRNALSYAVSGNMAMARSSRCTARCSSPVKRPTENRGAGKSPSLSVEGSRKDRTCHSIRKHTASPYMTCIKMSLAHRGWQHHARAPHTARLHRGYSPSPPLTRPLLLG